MMRVLLAIAGLVWVATAAADLYRWVDPETGSVKFSSYPPPWYGDAAKERRAPKVIVIPAGKEPPPLKDDEPAPRPEAAAARTETAPAPSAVRPEGAPQPALGGPPPANETSSLAAERREILQTLLRMAAQPDLQRAAPAFRRQLDSFQALSAELDRRDPLGAAARKFEVQPLLDKLIGSVPSTGAPR